MLPGEMDRETDRQFSTVIILPVNVEEHMKWRGGYLTE